MGFAKRWSISIMMAESNIKMTMPLLFLKKNNPMKMGSTK
jgi:hypothetical protein